jgi:hypothetical protein
MTDERNASGDSAAEDQMRALERQRLQALVNADMETANTLHADDFQLINPFGEALTKEEYLGKVVAGALEYRVFKPASPIAVLLVERMAALRYRSRTHVVADGQESITQGWHTDLYELRDEHWQAVWSQMTAIS